MDLDKPEIISTNELYRGRQFNLVVDRIQENERVHTREVVLHPGSAAILAVDSDAQVALVRQYRHATRKYLLEIPAGSLDPGETPEDAAARELIEEVGLKARYWEKLSEFFVSPGFLQEKMWLFFATDLSKTEQRLESDEILEVVHVPFTQALEMITAGEIEDAKTIIGLMLAAPRVGSPMLEIEYPAV